MKLVILANINKSTQKQGLVLRKVPVKLPSGQISMANRWVRPNKEQGKDTKSVKDNRETNKPSHLSPSPFESQSTMSADGVTPVAQQKPNGMWEGADGYEYDSEMSALQGQYYNGPDILYDSKDNKWSIEGKDETYSTELQAYREAHKLLNKRRPMKAQSLGSKEDSLEKYIEDIGTLVEDFMFDYDTRGDNINEWIDLEDLAGEIMDYYSREITESVESHIPVDKGHASTIQNRQFNAGFGNKYNPFSVLGSEPRVLKTTLEKMLGNEVYESMRKQVENSTLSINLDKQVLENQVIPEGVYKANTPERRLNELGQEAVDRYNSIVDEIDDSDHWSVISNRLIDAYKDADGKEREIVRGIAKRARYEQTHLEVRLKDPKPVYIAYNISNSSLGGQDYYGESWMEISEDILPHCTVGRTDSYYGGDTVPFVHNMDHLHDLSILKAIGGDFPVSKRGILNNKMDEDLGIPAWASESYHEGDVALEIHYHKPELSMSYVKKYHKDVF